MNPNATIRQACEAIFTAEAGYSRQVIKDAQNLVVMWERFVASDPPVGRITDDTEKKFYSALDDLGMRAAESRRYRIMLRSTLNKSNPRKCIAKVPRTTEVLPTAIDGTLRSHYHVTFRRFRLAGKSEQSDDNYRINLRHFDRILDKPATLDDLTDQNILDGMNWLVSKGRSRATANKFRVAICALWNFLAKRGVVKTWPTVQPFKLPERTPRAWTESQLVQLFDELANQKKHIGGLPAALWWQCLHLFFWLTAERLTAALMLRVDDVDLETGWIHCRAETRKFKTRDKPHRLSPEALSMFRQFVALQPGRELMFPVHFCTGTLWYRYATILKKAGLPHSSRDMFHKMRRSAISHFAARGGDGTKLADHGTSAVTRKSYLDPTIVVDQQASDLLFHPIRKASGL